MAAEKVPANLYPKLTLEHIKDPNRLWAIPLLGGFIKFIILIPVWIELVIVGIVFFFVSIINSLVVLFTGKYWTTAYELLMGLTRLSVKLMFFWFGVTNTYPGFDFTIKDKISVEMAMPKNPNRFFAIPLVGGIVRIILMIPMIVWTDILQYAASLGSLVSTLPVLFMGKYPESTYELVRDHMRVALAVEFYVNGLTEQYPSFWISWNHKAIKIVLIILGVLALLGQVNNSVRQQQYRNSMYNNNYYNQQMMNQNGQNNGNMMYNNSQNPQ